jgi:hypothetical protein
VFHAGSGRSNSNSCPIRWNCWSAEERGGYRIALSHTAAEPTVFLEAETRTRYRVIEFPAENAGGAGDPGRARPDSPAAARDQVVAMVRRNSPTLPIRAEIAEMEQPGIEGVAPRSSSCCHTRPG